MKVHSPSADFIPDCSTLDNVDFAFNIVPVPVVENLALQKYCEIQVKMEDDMENSTNNAASSDVLLQNEYQDITSKQVCIFMHVYMQCSVYIPLQYLVNSILSEIIQ